VNTSPSAGDTFGLTAAITLLLILAYLLSTVPIERL
jgi:hypothetical protein